jgi:hypothetical protein
MLKDSPSIERRSEKGTNQTGYCGGRGGRLQVRVEGGDGGGEG